MRKFRFIVFILTLGWLPLCAQVPDEESLDDVILLFKTIQSKIPYYDEANRLSIVGVNMNPDNRFLRVELALPKGEQVRDADWYLNYMLHNEKWDMSPLLKHSYDLRLLVKLPKKAEDNSGGAAFNFHPEDLAAALAPPLEVQARTFAASLARRVNSTLPHATGEGETMVECRYDEAKRVMTTVYEYRQDHWPEVRQYVMDNMDWVRKDRAAALVMDTANHLAFVSYKGDITLRHVYRDERHTDSVEMTIAPWMWKTVYERGAKLNDNFSQIQMIADEMNSQCPSRVDDHTVLNSCVFDTAARQLIYTYKLSNSSMRSLRRDKRQREQLAYAIKQAYISGEGRRLATHLVEADVSVAYHYLSDSTDSPVSILVTPSELKQILSTQQ